MHILALSGGEGPNFKLLGVPFDTALNMKDAVVEIVGAATWKMGAILITARYFTNAELLQLYKSKLLLFFQPSPTATASETSGFDPGSFSADAAA